jgi:hypothetical protein
MEEAEVTKVAGVLRMGRRRGMIALYGGLLGLAALVLVAMVVGLVVGAHGDPSAAGAMARISAILTMLGGFGLWHQLKFARAPVGPPAELRAGQDGVFLGAERLATRAELRAGAVALSNSTGTVVHLERRQGPPIDLRVPTAEAGRALLHALGLGASKSTARYPIAALATGDFHRRRTQALVGIPALVGGAVGASVAAHGLLPPALAGLVVLPVVAAAFVVWAVLLVRLFSPGSATVGADGVELRWRGQERFIPLDEIVAVEPFEQAPALGLAAIGVRFRLRDGTTHDALVGMARTAYYRGAAYNEYLRSRAASLAERVREVLGERQSGDGAPALDPTQLERAARPVDAWVAALRALTHGADTFRRDVTVLGEKLLRLVEDTSANAVTRAAAAVAVARHADERTKLRIAAAAEATASPRLRVALEAAAADDEKRIHDTLGKLAAADAEVDPAERAAAAK